MGGFHSERCIPPREEPSTLTYCPQRECVFPRRPGTCGAARASVQDGSDRSGRFSRNSCCISCGNADRDITLPCTSFTRALALPTIMSLLPLCGIYSCSYHTCSGILIGESFFYGASSRIDDVLRLPSGHPESQHRTR